MPSDYAPVDDPRETQSSAAMVPRFYLAHEARQQHARAAHVDRDRLGIAVLADIAGRAEVTA
ncbi:hypothetical protein [Nocardiopsis halotolerans]|uniref:hypothetical protein n=1 Tax=Nocardiopsis halotolerans TaxID=124252 RepID=UPI000A07A903|nr:hypothetical protein [Nocardiopsis halotolerans]